MIIDTHAHVYGDDFYSCINDLVVSFKKNKIEKVVLPGTSLEDDRDIKKVVEACSDVFAPLVGIHPENICCDYLSQLNELEEKLSSGYDYIGVGEVGLDFYCSKNNIKEQVEFLKGVFDIVSGKKMPVSLHCREAFGTMFQILKDKQHGNLGGVIHCFTGDLEQAQKFIDLGFYLGIGGVITFKKSKIPNVVKEIGLGRIVLETDSPYLAPEPVRGTKNNPTNLGFIITKISEVLGIDCEEIERVTTSNAKKIFKFKPF